MTKSLKILVVLLLAGFFGCRDDSYIDKYARPDWLAGKVYSQLKAQPELSVFAKCIELTGYDKILDVSGSYTVFAPSDDAFALYFQQHARYKKIEDIPKDELNDMVKYHIVQNPWSKIQLRTLDVYGWIDTLDINNNKPRGFKRETLLMGKDLKYGIKPDLKHISIIDTLSATWKRKAATDSRKYAPIFFGEYFNIYDLSPSDYEFYFQRPFDSSSDIYFAGGKVIGDEIFAENGFVYVIDRVINPLKNGSEILKSNESGHSYTSFLELINAFPDFEYNEDKTNNQPGAKQGLQVDSLFELKFPELTFDINRETTKAPASAGLPYNVTIRMHHGLMAPNNVAFQEFINQYIAGSGNWGNLRETPRNVKRIIVNTYMSINPIYETNITKGFLNGESDLVKPDKSTIVQKQFGSNCTFIGLNKAIIPRAFMSVLGPIYQKKGYSRIMFAIEEAGLSAALKRQNQDYMLFVESDMNLGIDSSLHYNVLTERFSAFQITGGTHREIALTKNDLRTLILSHIGTANPKGVAKKEFIRNLGGNFLVVNNQTGEITGTASTMVGYNGAIPAKNLKPRPISINADNGRTFEIDNWFSFSANDLYSKISTTYPKFHNLLVSAGLAKTSEYRYTFISESENYTVFAPNDAALNTINTGGMTKEQLKKFLMMHFVQGSLIFTDGNQPSGYYETVRVDEKSTQYTTVYTQMYIQTEPDKIMIRGKTGVNYLTIPESPLVNFIASRITGTGSEAIRNILATAVIHEIDKPLLYEEIDTK